MPTIEHYKRDGVLCWGGPNHGLVLAIPNYITNEYVFPVMRRPEAQRPSDEPSLLMSRVTYYLREFVIRWNDFRAEQWYVLLYGENRERLMDNFTGTTKLVMWMASPYG